MMVLTVMFLRLQLRAGSLTPADLAAAKQNISILSTNHFNAPIIARVGAVIAMIAITQILPRPLPWRA